MDLRTLDWDTELLDTIGVPRSMLPRIRSSGEVYGMATGALEGVPVAGDLGDQQAATGGQSCYSVGEAKNTYRTGNFMLLNTGTELVPSKSGLLTTVAYKFGDLSAVYALEGSIAVTGALVQWLRDNLGLISQSAEVEALAKTVQDSGGIYFVPAFSGLFAPYWKNDARGVIVGLTRYVHKGHIARAALEATAFQTREVVEAMESDSGVKLAALKVDGGMDSVTREHLYHDWKAPSSGPSAGWRSAHPFRPCPSQATRPTIGRPSRHVYASRGGVSGLQRRT